MNRRQIDPRVQSMVTATERIVFKSKQLRDACKHAAHVDTRTMATDRKTRLQEFVAWSAAHIAGDEKGDIFPSPSGRGLG